MTNHTEYFNLLFPDNMTGWDIVKAPTDVFNEVLRPTFWLVILTIPFYMSYIQQKDTIIPTVLYLILGGMMYGLAPTQMLEPAKYMLFIGITSSLYHLYKSRT